MQISHLFFKNFLYSNIISVIHNPLKIVISTSSGQKIRHVHLQTCQLFIAKFAIHILCLKISEYLAEIPIFFLKHTINIAWEHIFTKYIFLFLYAFVLHAVPQEFDASSEMVFAPIVGKTYLADFLRIKSIATVCGIRRAPRKNIFFGGGLLFWYLLCVKGLAGCAAWEFLPFGARASEMHLWRREITHGRKWEFILARRTHAAQIHSRGGVFVWGHFSSQPLNHALLTCKIIIWLNPQRKRDASRFSQKIYQPEVLAQLCIMQIGNLKSTSVINSYWAAHTNTIIKLIGFQAPDQNFCRYRSPQKFKIFRDTGEKGEYNRERKI